MSVYRRCSCTPTCKATTKSKMAPGHDMRLIGWLKERMAAYQVDEQSGMSVEQARREALRRGATAGLMTRLEVTIKRGGFG